MARYSHQLYALIWRNIQLKLKSKFQLFMETFFPFEVMLLLLVAKDVDPALNPAISFPAYSLNSSHSLVIFNKDSFLLGAPNLAQYREWLEKAALRLPGPPTVKMFSSAQKVQDFYMEAEYKEQGSISAGVIFNQSEEEYSYMIRFNPQLIPKPTENFSFMEDQCRLNKSESKDFFYMKNCPTNSYLYSGFSQLQLALENALLETLNVSWPDPWSRDVKVRMMDLKELPPNTDAIQFIAGICIVGAFFHSVGFIAVSVVADKESKVKEGMMMMGLPSSVFWLSWGFSLFLPIMIANLGICVIFRVSGFFSQSNILIMLFALTLYGISIITLTFVLSTLFDKKTTAGTTCSIIVLFMGIPQLILVQLKSGSYNPIWQWISCLSSPSAMITFMNQAIFLDAHMDGFNFDESLIYGEFPLAAALLMLVVDIILYAILIVYREYVTPNSHGRQRHPCFCLSKRFIVKDEFNLAVTDISTTPVDIEPVDQSLKDKIAMRINEITKTFIVNEAPIIAVDQFSLDIYQDQITCLLGHNGAGKTTLINILTGLIKPTKGTVTILGLDVSKPTDLFKLRCMCGVCPQENILNPELTCWQHLKIFALIKGVNPEDVPSAIMSTLIDVDLVSQKNVQANNLSGGQKRKLSVGIALIGDPKLLILDEPTAGVDTVSRRHLWSLLKRKKEGRVVLLTTHFMDEADILADRKAFISKGRLRCCGSSLFLKNKFGIGYHLVMLSSPTCEVDNVTYEVDKVTSALQNVIPSVSLKRAHGMEINYTIPFNDVKNFPDMFDMVDKNAEELGIVNYGVSMTTLEEVFLKIEEAELTEEHGEQEIAATPSSLKEIQMVSGWKLTRQKILALIELRAILARRHQELLSVQIFVPLFYAFLGILFFNTANPPEDNQKDKIWFDAEMYVGSDEGKSPLIVFENSSTSAKDLIQNLQTIVGALTNYSGGARNLLQYAPHALGLQIDSLTDKVLTDSVLLYNDTALHGIPTLITLVTQSILDSMEKNISFRSGSCPWPDLNIRYTDDSMMVGQIFLSTAFIIPLETMAYMMIEEREIKLRSLLRISGIGFNMYWLTTTLRNLVIYCIPILVTQDFIQFLDGVPGFNTPGVFPTLYLVFLTNMPLAILMISLLSFFFNKVEDCQGTLGIIVTFIMFAPVLYFVLFFEMLAERLSGLIITHYILCCIWPPYLFLAAIHFVIKLYRIEGSKKELHISDYLDPDNLILITIVAPLFHIIWMYVLLWVFDIQLWGGSLRDALPCLPKRGDQSDIPNPDVIEHEDEDVANERNKVEKQGNTDEKATWAAYTCQLRKVYVKDKLRKKILHGCTHICRKADSRWLKRKAAVRNLSIGINKGEILGLLGPNGAGKTSALNMIISETKASCGKVVVSGQAVQANRPSVLELIGYCPQHHALWENLTLEEHVHFFATIKGVDPWQVDELTNFYVSNLKLNQHRHKFAKDLSGGTKRKLNYIISMLGTTRIVLLDEPSTGMDPHSKRFLWDVINVNFHEKDKAAILTTHYMEEADALCDRVGIMVNGALKCLGSTQHLKNKFGSGYILEVKLLLEPGDDAQALMNELEKHLLSIFREMDVVERFAERAQYAIAKERVTSLGQAFSSLEKCKHTHNLEEYSFSQSSLEQVFLHFAKNQQEEGVDDVENGDIAKLEKIRKASSSRSSGTSKTMNEETELTILRRSSSV